MRGRDGRLVIRPSLFVFLALLFALPGPGASGPAALGFGPAELQAQEGSAGTVVGRVTETGTGFPQVGAFVALLDPDGERQAAVLTDEAGRYVLRVPAPGRYRLRVEGLGVASTFGTFFDFAAGEVREEDLEISPAALNIEGLEVTGAAQCDLSGGDGSATVRLWDEARKALEVAQWIDEIGYVYDITTFRRVLGADGEMVFQEEEARKTLVGQSPFVSMEAEALMADGFVVQDSLGFEYFGPDASVLLSDVFLAGHCFEAVREDGRLGLAFYPREGRRLPDIEGTLWFAGEGALDRLEYSYTGITEYENDDAVGGEIEFRRLPQGAWIVEEWAIRMPAAVVESPRGASPRLVRVTETGAVVREARGIARVDATISEGRGAVLGKVVAAVDPGPEAGRVYLSGTSYGTSPGPDGSFLLEGVQPGRYDLVVDHPALRVMGEGPQKHQVRVFADSIVSVETALPTREEVLAQRCDGAELVPLDAPHSRSGPIEAVGGVVRTPEGQSAGDRPVRVWWRYWPWVDRGSSNRDRDVGSRLYSGASAEWSGTVVRTDAQGAWVVCGVPERQIIYVDVPRLGLSQDEIEAGVGLGTEVTIDPLPSGAMRWVELKVREAGVPTAGGSGRQGAPGLLEPHLAASGGRAASVAPDRRFRRAPPRPPGLGIPGRGHDAPDHVADQLLVHPRLPGPLSSTADHPGFPHRIQDGAAHLLLHPPDLEDEVPPQADEADQLSVELLEAIPERRQASLQVAGPGLCVWGSGLRVVGSGFGGSCLDPIPARPGLPAFA